MGDTGGRTDSGLRDSEDQRTEKPIFPGRERSVREIFPRFVDWPGGYIPGRSTAAARESGLCTIAWYKVSI